MKTFLDKIRQTVRRFDLLAKGDKVLIACSGGADSVCLLHALVALGSEWELKLMVGHFNHQLRPDAIQDEEFVRELAHSFSLQFISESCDVSGMARDRHRNLEETARELRYAFLEKAANRLGATKVATGHTMTDQAETFFMRLIRGSGVRGLSGIFPIKEGKIIRPLLDVERAEIESYLQDNRISFRVDKSNVDRRYFRNRVRLDLLPYLRQNFDTRIVPHIGKLVGLLQAEDQALDDLVKEKAGEVIGKNQDGVYLDKHRLLENKLAVQRRLIRSFLSRLRGDLRGIDFDDVDSLLHLVSGKEFVLEKGLILKNQRGIISQKKDLPTAKAYSYSWEGTKDLLLPEAGLKLVPTILPHRTDVVLEHDDERSAYLDKAKLRFPLWIRNRLPGDRYRPLGSPGQKKLKEIMRAKGISHEKRDWQPVILSDDKIAWTLGLPVAHHLRITGVTTQIFQIQIEELESELKQGCD